MSSSCLKNNNDRLQYTKRDSSQKELEVGFNLVSWELAAIDIAVFTRNQLPKDGHDKLVINHHRASVLVFRTCFVDLIWVTRSRWTII